MQTLMQTLREILGTPDFYVKLEGSNNYSWDYGAMLEYGACIILIGITVVSIFKFLRAWVK